MGGVKGGGGGGGGVYVDCAEVSNCPTMHIHIMMATHEACILGIRDVQL